MLRNVLTATVTRLTGPVTKSGRDGTSGERGETHTRDWLKCVYSYFTDRGREWGRRGTVTRRDNCRDPWGSVDVCTRRVSSSPNCGMSCLEMDPRVPWSPVYGGEKRGRGTGLRTYLKESPTSNHPVGGHPRTRLDRVRDGA